MKSKGGPQQQASAKGQPQKQAPQKKPQSSGSGSDESSSDDGAQKVTVPVMKSKLAPHQQASAKSQPQKQQPGAKGQQQKQGPPPKKIKPSESGSGESSDDEPPAKKSQLAASKGSEKGKPMVRRNSRGEEMLSLGGNLFMTVSSLDDGKTNCVDVRQYYKVEGGGDTMVAGRTGVSLTAGQFTELKKLYPGVEEKVKQPAQK